MTPPDVKGGKDGRADNADVSAAFAEANRRLRNDGKFYNDVRRDFGAPN